jgi:ribosome-associated protein
VPDDASPPARGLEISPDLVIPESELVWRFGPSGGPGGQHANTANTRAELVFEIESSAVLDDAQRARLSERFGPRIRVACDDHRSQRRNREVAIDRLVERVRDGLRRPPTRRPTKPSRGAKERRLRAKRARSDTKARRRRPEVD